MTRVSPTPALARLRGDFPPVGRARVLVHRGTCGDAVGAEAVEGALRAAMPAAAIVEGACDGACWAAPAATVQREGHSHRFPRLDRGVPGELAACLAGQCDDEYAGRGVYGLMERLGRNDGTFADVIGRGAYGAAARAATLKPEQILAAVSATAVPVDTEQWWWVAQHPGQAHLLVDAGARVLGDVRDRHLLQGDPHRLIDGILVACRAIGASAAFVHINGEAPAARAAFERALEDARGHGILDGSALGGDPVTVEVRSGVVAAVAEDGSVVHDAETLCALSTVFDSPPPPTKLISLSGAVPRPGLYEVPVDGNTTWTGVLAMAGVAPGLVPGILLGGPDGHIVAPDEYEEPLTMSGLGTGGALVLPRNADIAEVTG